MNRKFELEKLIDRIHINSVPQMERTMMTKEQLHERSQAILQFAINEATGTEDEGAECDGREVIAALDAARFVMLTGMAQTGQLGTFFVGEAGDWSELAEEVVEEGTPTA